MSSLTSRLALTKPDPNDSMATGGSVLSANYDILDAAVGAPTYTSGTRPAAPWVGRVIFESDTNNLRFWNGSKWAYLGNTNNGFGRKGTLSLGPTGDVGPAELKLGSVEFSLLANRRYSIDYLVHAKNTAVTADSFQIMLRWTTGATPVTTAGTLLTQEYCRIVVTASNTVGKAYRSSYEWDYTGIDTLASVGIFVVAGGGASNKMYDNDSGGAPITGSFAITDYGIH